MKALARLRRGTAAATFAVAALWSLGAAEATDKISYGLGWVPQAEHCGFFEAKAAGLYDAAGLDVTLVPGGPDVNLRLQLLGGNVDTIMGSALSQLLMSAQNLPVITVASFLQKNPQTLVAHPDPDLKTISDLKGRPVMIAQQSRQEFWGWIKKKYGLDDGQLRPYAFNAAPFLADPKAVVQGYVTNDGLMLGKPLGAEPKIFLLSDAGWMNFTNTVQTTTEFAKSKPEVLAKFVKVSAEGWKRCIAGDYAAAKALILKVNPDMPADMIDYSMKVMIDRKMMQGDQGLPIGGMTDANWSDFYNSMVEVGVVKPGIDLKSAYTLSFVK
jgi:NitT/TauT family transport system substrate-binding protein